MRNECKHIGLILDGNRRWAKAHGFPAIEGHRQGYKNLKTIVEAAAKLNVKFISAYVFSSENWTRSSDEVSGIMKLLLWVLKNEIKSFHKQNVRILFAGCTDNLRPEIIKSLSLAEELTKNNTKITVVVCINYGGRQEITDAVKKIIDSGLDSSKITDDIVQENLYQPNIPPPDLVIRTSGEQRLSNFLTWQSAYSELVFTDKLWPDFTAADLKNCIGEFYKRTRRFGK